ncbi:MAG TPA: hypothetical protein VFQ41_00685 [Candidatus Angelobacter sp.]|nr:hypothetical protein [Candidatus Angelobacter sp.]
MARPKEAASKEQLAIGKTAISQSWLCKQEGFPSGVIFDFGFANCQLLFANY